MRVSIFTPNASGGAFANISRSLARGLAELQIPTDIVYLAGPQPCDLPPFPTETRLVRLGRRSRTAAPALARYLRHHRPDALISLGWVQNPAAVVAVALARTGTLLLLNEQSILSYKTQIEHRDQLQLRLLATLARLLYPRATAVTGASADIVADLAEKIGLKNVPLLVVPNPVDGCHVIRRSREPASVVVPAGSQPLFVSVARHARQKNLPLLLHAFRTYTDESGLGVLVLIGSGPDTPDLRRLTADLSLDDRVRFLGPHRNPYPQIAAATALVLSSEEEGFGLVLVEAMALGIPVVSTDCPGGPRDILQNGSAGLIVPSGDRRALADAMHRIAEDPHLRAELSRRGRLRAQDFSPMSVAKQWCDVINRYVPAQAVSTEKGTR